MLTHLQISNLITIQTFNLELHPGTTVITGETGAGKSILIDAIELALGGRATSEVIRSGQEKADISLCFDCSNLPEVQIWLKNYDLEQPSAECIIRRVITKDGRSRSYINGQPITLQPLRELSELLLHIHGQHEHQALLKTEVQRCLLDRYAEHPLLLDHVRELSSQYHHLSQALVDLKQRTAERSKQMDLLKFQLAELVELNLTPNEFHSLELEYKQLIHADELLKNMTHAMNCLGEQEEQNVLRLIKQSVQALETIQEVNPKIATWIENINHAAVLIADVEYELNRYLSSIELDPGRLHYVEERMNTLFALARKYKIAPEELITFQQKLTLELAELENSDEHIQSFTANLTSLAEDYMKAAKKLTQSRTKAAKNLAQEITMLINELALPHGEFHIEFITDDHHRFSPLGTEKVLFQIKTNAGHTAQPLAKIASGGELSRISLAIRIATAAHYAIPTLIFDEVDVGIGGGVAEVVGKLLRRLGETHQVLCITHQPQVAAQGHHHIRVEKVIHQNEAHTRIHALSTLEKIKEVARMLGGVKITEKTLDHAREMVEASH